MGALASAPVRASLLTLLWMLGCLACSGCAAHEAQTSGGRASGVERDNAHAARERPWHALSHDERKAYMQRAVAPSMESVFVAHDAERFAAFGCRTCHGASARERGYRMPNPELPALYPTGSAEQKATVEKHRATARFMHQQVIPNMRALLGARSYDPATGQGFSCFHCHPRGEPVQAAADGGGS